ncbi:hypothetical protein CVT24_011562 [Panaeolus cyanescens]|uniref:Uncharacterized protein n=1 Tax=Panaeolus cyanescens TaxID=181874 RepID=A0A409YV65_9AGAR|nr:hypothetical protein CVT24_011562 [Panaeolus cyanescens]
MKSTVECAIDTKHRDHASCLKTVQAVFTDKCKLDNIKRVLDLIAAPSAKFPVIEMKEDLGPHDTDTLACPLWDKVGTLIHEASHWLASTFDYWEYNVEKTKLFPVPPPRRPGAINGGWEHQFDELKEKSPKLLHKNADTWAIFAFYVFYRKFPDKLAFVPQPPTALPPAIKKISQERTIHVGRKPSRRISIS